MCDGTNGTPDLRDRFIYGCSGGENPGATGGANTYRLTVSQLPAHTHGVGSYAIEEEGVAASSAEKVYYEFGIGHRCDNRKGFCNNCGGHTHTISGNSGSRGGGAEIDNRPTYYKLAFIMRL